MSASRGDPDHQLLEALSAVAAERLPQVLEQARQDAERRVRELLADALTERMLQLAKSPPSAEPTREATTDSGLGLYVLGITGADVTLPATKMGADGPDARLIEHAGLSAIVCTVPLAEFGEEELRRNLEDIVWLERIALAHETALELLCEQLTVVPARLCTVYRSPDSVRAMLALERESLIGALERLRGRHEWGVKVFQLETEPTTEPGGDERQPDSGAEYLRGRQRQRESRLRQAGELAGRIEALHVELAGAAVDAVVNPPQRRELSGHRGEMALNGVYLVDRAREGRFLELVEQLAERHREAGLELQPTGPWPPYNFVSETIGAAL